MDDNQLSYGMNTNTIFDCHILYDLVLITMSNKSSQTRVLARTKIHTTTSIMTAGEEFTSFPYPPYDIQRGFMQALFKALQHGGIGFFESPTGTGKTLSLICGSLEWLQYTRKKEEESKERSQNETAPSTDAKQGGEDDDDPDWMKDFASKHEEDCRKHDEELRAQRIAKTKAKLVKRMIKQQQRKSALQKEKQQAASRSLDADAEFLLEECGNEDIGDGPALDGKNVANVKKRSMLSSALLYDDDSSDSDPDENDTTFLSKLKISLDKEIQLYVGPESEEIRPPQKRQIIFCSRTHSQLTQFVGELHKTPFADSMALVALGSRRALCINPTVAQLHSPGLINERCLELQKPSSSSSNKKAALVSSGNDVAAPGIKSGRPVPESTTQRTATTTKCPYIATGTPAADAVRDIILAHPMDIEELAKLGSRKSICPYYACRRAVPEADIVLAPYSALLVKETREALGLKIEGNVLIIDEAHNLGRSCCVISLLHLLLLFIAEKWIGV